MGLSWSICICTYMNINIYRDPVFTKYSDNLSLSNLALDARCGKCVPLPPDGGLPIKPEQPLRLDFNGAARTPLA